MSELASNHQHRASANADTERQRGAAVSTLLVIGSGLKVLPDTWSRPSTAAPVRPGCDWCCSTNLKPTWQKRYFDEIVLADVFDPAVMVAEARRSRTGADPSADVLGRAAV